MKKIAILYICTGKYSVLWKEFFESSEKNFLPNCKKEYFVFTDAEKIECNNDITKIHLINQEALNWPYATLLRFHMFNKISQELSTFDYIFFFNANALIVNTVTEDMILPRKGKNEDICVVKHPAYRNCKPFEFPYDRNFKCKAFIPYGLGKVYVQGCLIGGTADGFLEMSEHIAHQIDIDLNKNIIALWHDESYLNKYVLKKKKYRLLGIDFANPLSDDPHKAMIHMRQKDRYFSTSDVKKDSPKTQLKGLNRIYYEKIYRFLSKKAIFKCDYKNIKNQYGIAHGIAWGIKNFWKVFIIK